MLNDSGTETKPKRSVKIFGTKTEPKPYLKKKFRAGT